MAPFGDPEIPALLERLRRAMDELRGIGRELAGAVVGASGRLVETATGGGAGR